MNIRAARWGDNDRYFGPFTVSRGDFYRTFAICLRSSDDEDRLATFRLSIGRTSFLSVVPKWLIPPERKKVQARYWSEADIARLGRDWYWEIIPREYGVSLNEGHLSVYYGRVTHDSSTEQRWGCFLPWTQWRHIRHSHYGADGELFWTEPKGSKSFSNWEERQSMIDKVPVRKFIFRDENGAEIIATTRIEECEWLFGTGWFKWLSWFRKPKIHRSLNLSFSAEVGPERGSWKGGMVGTSIEMRPGELHEEAFRRFCEQEHRSKYQRYRIEYVGPSSITPND